MIKLNQISMPIGFEKAKLQDKICSLLSVTSKDIQSWNVAKQSIDSREKDNIKYVISVVVQLVNERDFIRRNAKFAQSIVEKQKDSVQQLLNNCNFKKTSVPPVVVGSGPCGLFAALVLARAGACPIIIERGHKVEERQLMVQIFERSGILDVNCNIQFGEGGAGTFSDGKLNTGISDEKINIVLNEFVRFGADPDILYDAKPHIGTDILVKVVKNMRLEIERLGGQFMFDTRLVDVVEKDGKLSKLILKKTVVLKKMCDIFQCQNLATVGSDNVEQNNVATSVENTSDNLQKEAKGNKNIFELSCTNETLEIDCNQCILAIGHSARDTFEVLSKKVIMQQKPFAIGVRIEHLQKDISFAQYGGNFSDLPPADYKLACHLDNGRSCFSFCMCPGGVVAAAASEYGGVVTNGMSNRARDGRNANSALLVGVLPSDFGSSDVLAGVEFQRKYEKLAYRASANFAAPVQRFGDFENKKISASFGKVEPTYPLGTYFGDLRNCLPNYVSDSLAQAIRIFDRKIKGFAHPDSLLCGVETRSSSPVRIVRDERGSCSIGGLMPSGEGAGYAGGITSASVDGITQALLLLDNVL